MTNFLQFCLVQVFSLVLCFNAEAGNVSLTLSVTAQDDTVEVEVINTESDAATNLSAEVELDGEYYRLPLASFLAAGEKTGGRITVRLPGRVGTYPLITKVKYENEGVPLSLLDVGYFNYPEHVLLDQPCELHDLFLRHKLSVSFAAKPAVRTRLIIPDEVGVFRRDDGTAKQSYQLTNLRPGFNSNYPVFQVLQSPPEAEIQRTKICRARLVTSSNLRPESSVFSNSFLLGAAILGFALSLGCFRAVTQGRSGYGWVVFARYSFSLFLVSLLWLSYRAGARVADWALPSVLRWRTSSEFGGYCKNALKVSLQWLYLEDKAYLYFFSYFADYLYAFMLTANLLVLYLLIRPEPGSDKYWSLMKSVYSLPILRRLSGLPNCRRFFWSTESRVAILSLLVKGYYLPLLVGWTINQGLHFGATWKNAMWSMVAVNDLLVQLLILIDVTFFAFGYLTELPQLRNQIRSVEPTILGWGVCLICYPPFNQFSFAWADQALNESWQPAQGVMHSAALCLITVLWAIYVWASVALGPRASNLTNRGVVDFGPYRYIRHPAYLAKVSLWIVSSFFLSSMNFYLILALLVTYSLRAWTEERHLKGDPEYRAYCQRTPYRAIPGVF